MLIINIILYMILGIFLGHNGFGIDTHQYWVILGLVLAIQINAEVNL